MDRCPECNGKIDVKEFEGKEYCVCKKCNKEFVKEIENPHKHSEDDKAIERIRSMLTPDTVVCKTCITTYKNECTCGHCNTIMIAPEYSGKTFKCPVCDQLLCEKCFEKGK